MRKYSVTLHNARYRVELVCEFNDLELVSGIAYRHNDTGIFQVLASPEAIAKAQANVPGFNATPTR